MLHLMINVLAITHDLSQILQRREQDLVNALKLVTIVKQRLAAMKTDIGWGALFDEVVTFCNKFHIDVPSMDQKYIKGKRSKRRAPSITNMHHYKPFDCNGVHKEASHISACVYTY
ncbi:unnamed protein product [Cuscuta europaea]|uniref:Uncharacterized protein n=1 Tax=Cuscuta europaea TaxID=41803 RepID=A0A9P0YJF2_CUSEU|nr:unnamed protein product [Cuscuta europaea]